jgi:hypothetical protein
MLEAQMSNPHSLMFAVEDWKVDVERRWSNTMKYVIAVIATLALAMSASAVDDGPLMPTLFIEAHNNFDIAITAAIKKKGTPVAVVTNKNNAVLVLRSSDVDQKVDTDTNGIKAARIIFGVQKVLPASVSVQLINSNGSVLWAYSCVKSQHPSRNEQSLSEAIAKHLKEYLEKNPVPRNAPFFTESKQ